MTGLGGKLLERPKDLETAIKFTNSCYKAYEQTQSGMGPEVATYYHDSGAISSYISLTYIPKMLTVAYKIYSIIQLRIDGQSQKMKRASIVKSRVILQRSVVKKLLIEVAPRRSKVSGTCTGSQAIRLGKIKAGSCLPLGWRRQSQRSALRI